MSSKQTAVVILYPGCVSYDVALAAELLSRNYEIKTATADGKVIADASGLPLSVQQKISEVDLQACRAILLPGGEARGLPTNAELSKLLQQAHAKGIFILAIGEATLLLKNAGLKFQSLENRAELYSVEGSIIIAQAEGGIDGAVELGARLDVLDAKFVTRTKDHYRGLLGRKTRALALAVIKDDKGRYLVHQMFDNKRKQIFYRPVGGGIDFHEPARVAIAREIREELGFEILVDDLARTFENIFVMEDIKGHEVVFVFRAHFKDQAAYAKPELAILESGKSVGKAVWKTVAEIHAEGSALYPVGIETLLI